MKYLIFDTETTGLNIITDTPFMFQYGLVDDNLNLVKIEVFYANDLNSKQKFINYLKTIDTYVGHNLKYDCHMLINSGISLEIFKNKNFIDTQMLARLVIDHDKQSENQFSISLKKLAVKYLGIDSASEEHALKSELSNLTMQHKEDMKNYFIKKGLWNEQDSSTKQTKIINDVYNKWTKYFHKYIYLKDARREFLKINPAPNYANCSNIYNYGKTDIILTHGLFKLWYPQVSLLKQIPTLIRTSKALIPLLLMERKGMTVDINKILIDRNILLKEISKTKIVDPRTKEILNVGQHAKLKELYEYESGETLENADKNTRAEILNDSPAARAASYLAGMHKYINTYITGVLNKLVYIDGQYKIHTQYNEAGTVTGRLTSNFQQFPREALVLKDGTEINIRSWFIVPKEDKYLFYFDYAQMELRLQCEWTEIINGSPDVNMARAFTPYECTEINGKYYLNEDLKIEWHPVDLHGATAKIAFPDIDESNPDWKHYRDLGKRANFACNYGASAPAVQNALKISFSEAQSLVKGYRHTFKGVVDFSKWLRGRVYITESIPNLLLRRYYSRNSHLLLNWLIQGSGADILLEKLRELYNYIEDKPHWNLYITVHDEIGLSCKDIPETQLKKEVADIKEIMVYNLTSLNIISDVEYTTTKWSEKIDWS